jgi:hypothetical protein
MRRAHPWRRSTGVVAVVGLVMAAGPSSRAGGTGSDACGSSPASWNVPAGAIVLSRASGPVSGVLSALGEYRTHSMIAHGNGWATHAAMYTPSMTGWPTYCSTPLDGGELEKGYPGASQIQEGGIYQFLYAGSLEYIAFQRGCSSVACPNGDGQQVADWIWNTIPFDWTNSKQGTDGLYRIEIGTPPAVAPYSLYQFRDIQSLQTGGGTWNNGVVCSTLISYSQYMAGRGAITAYTYSHDQVVSGINGLLGSVEDECNQGIGFWQGVAATITCFQGICDNAARQVTNCMAVGRCDTDSSGSNTYASVRDDPNSTATSISPDRLGGWSGHPWQGYVDGTEGSGVSVWAADNEQTVQWNSPGNVYGCWF